MYGFSEAFLFEVLQILPRTALILACISGVALSETRSHRAETDQRAQAPTEDLVEIVWDVNSTPNSGPKPGKIEEIGLLRPKDRWLVLSKESLEGLRVQGAILHSQDHGTEAVKELIANSILKRRAGVPLRIRLYIEAHGFRGEGSEESGIATDSTCKTVKYNALFEELLGKNGLIPPGDTVRLDVFVTACFSRRAAYSFYKFHSGQIPEYLDDVGIPPATHRVNLFTTSKGSRQTWSARFWDTLELIYRLEQVREVPMGPEEFNSAVVAFGRIKAPPPYFVPDTEWPLFVNRYSTYAPNSESSAGRPRLEPFLRLGELGMAKLQDITSFCVLTERIGTVLSEPAWNISSMGEDRIVLEESPELIADRLVGAFLSNPKATELTGCLRNLRWQPFHSALLKSIGSGAANREILLKVMSDNSEFYRSSYGAEIERFLLGALRSKEQAERENALVVAKHIVPESSQAPFNGVISALAHDSDPNLRRLALYFLISRDLVTIDDGLERLEKENESSVRQSILSAMIAKAASNTKPSGVARTRLVLAGLAEPSQSIQNEVLGTLPLGHDVSEWEAFATLLETRMDRFNDLDWLVTQSQLKRYEEVAALPDNRRTFWRIYNFISHLGYQRKGALDLTRGSSVNLRKQMDQFLRKNRKL